MSSRGYAFILNSSFLPDPYLVEMSHRTKTTLRDLAFYGPNVIYIPKELDSIMRSILKFRYLSLVHLEKVFVHWLKRSPQSAIKSSFQARELAVDAIIEYELRRRMGVRRNTRLFNRILKKLKSQVLHVREKRLRDECHITMSFHEDYQRSIHELAYVLKKER
jgi:hypothetical protein